MKACFLLQRRFAYIGHIMAQIFRKKYGINEFCGFIETRSSFEFLKSQNDITYTQLLLDEDIHKQYKNEPLDLDYLKNLEKKYGLPNLWPYIELDRVIRYNLLIREYPYDTPRYTHEEMMRIVQVNAKNIIKFLEEEKPNFIVFSVIGSIGSLLLYQIAKKMGIKTFFIRFSRVGTKYSITEDYNEMSYIEKTFVEIQKNNGHYEDYIRQAEKLIEEFRNKPAPPHSIIDTPEARPVTRKKQFSFLLPHKIFKSIGWLFKMSYGYFSDKNRNDYCNVKPWLYIWDRIKRKIRVLIGFDDLYDKVNLNDDFAFFPLHFEPEIVTALYAPFYTDQLWLIKQIARSLPIHYKLYVKEHPAMFGYRTRRYYKELKKIPNIKLIKPTITSFDFIKYAKLIITLSSSAGWEALLFKKPVITFGNGFYNKISMVRNCKAIEDLPQIVKEQLENFNYDEKALLNLIAAIYKESVDIDLAKIWVVEGGGQIEKYNDKFTDLVDFIAAKLSLKK